ncbi:MAG: TlyA family RNA methyltransferase [Spirochaetes bacterium]|nr:TlyA family RNA methyltransferase [Spirochaetota bacterium]
MKKEKLIDLIIKKYNLSEKEAVGLILSGDVLINEQSVTKAGIKIDEDSNIRIKNKEKYVSRAAYKLLTAFENFRVSIKGKVCLDVGSSTGGFTQVLLEKGAKRVFAVDCGKNQLNYALRNDPRVNVMENRKINDLTIADFDQKIEFAVMDVSFCSSIFLIKHLYQILKIDKMIILIKPQFEYNRLSTVIELSGKFNGIVKNEEERKKIIEYIRNEILGMDLNVYSMIASNIKGTKGNLEYLFYIGKKE